MVFLESQIVLARAVAIPNTVLAFSVTAGQYLLTLKNRAGLTALLSSIVQSRVLLNHVFLLVVA
jgi:hypothetical protein